MKHFSHLNTATQLVQQYGGREPLHHFLKTFFSQHKKFGSKDRKRISHLCYVFYRVAHAVHGEFSTKNSELIQQIILAGLFLCSNKGDDLLVIAKPLWNEMINKSIHEKAEIIKLDDLNTSIDLQNIFPATDELSAGIDLEAFNLSHLHQPDLFIRVRPRYEDIVIQKLEKQDVQYELLQDSGVRLPNGLKMDEMFEIDKEVVVQDISSQMVGNFLNYLPQFSDSSQVDYGSPQNISVWDCCAASGGKSIMVKDILGDVDLTVSDVRESILLNLKKRFQNAGIINYSSVVADLSHTNSQFTTHHSPFDLIIADLPCTGSGTWGRTPEQLYFFERSSIERYCQLQKRIVMNILPHLKETGRLLYITCSVFKKENEEIIEYLLERFPLKIERMEIIKGYDKKADTMFAALLSRL